MSSDLTHLVHFADTPAGRWANGLGETVELWRTPADGAFTVRLSIATVDTAAAFSSLPGVDRALMPLAPAGLTVRVDATTHVLAQYETLRFAGEASAASVDVRETGRDLNLMVRRGAGHPTLSTVSVGDGAGVVTVDGRNDHAVAVIALDGAPTWDGMTLSFGDTVLTGAARVVVRGNGLVAIARVDWCVRRPVICPGGLVRATPGDRPGGLVHATPGDRPGGLTRTAPDSLPAWAGPRYAR